MTGKKGMTLVELLVYMALAALLLAPVIMLTQNSAVNMARDASNASLRMNGREILNIMYDDLKNTGFKMSGFEAKIEATYLNPAKPPAERDSSSFKPGKIAAGALYDTLTAISGKLNGAGAWIGADTVRYCVDISNGNALKREVLAGNGNPKSDETGVLARNVAALRFQYAEDPSDGPPEWYDIINYNNSNPTADDLDDKIVAKYIKVIMVLKDDKRLAATKTQSIKVVPGVTITDNSSQALYERHEVVIPIPNNGLFP
jgi:Tfp pilus assembly protein PilW